MALEMELQAHKNRSVEPVGLRIISMHVLALRARINRSVWSVTPTFHLLAPRLKIVAT